MNITLILNKLENLPKEVKGITKRKEFLINLEDQFLKKKNLLERYRYSNEAGIEALEKQINCLKKELKQLTYKEEFLKQELSFYRSQKIKIESFLAGNDYEKEIYREKYIDKYSITKISVRHNNIQETTIRNILRKVEKDVQNFLSEDLFQEWLGSLSVD